MCCIGKAYTVHFKDSLSGYFILQDVTLSSTCQVTVQCESLSGQIILVRFLEQFL